MPIPAAFDLSGRVAVVTGAGGPDGIGFATARLLAELGAAGPPAVRQAFRVSHAVRARLAEDVAAAGLAPIAATRSGMRTINHRSFG